MYRRRSRVKKVFCSVPFRALISMSLIILAFASFFFFSFEEHVPGATWVGCPLKNTFVLIVPLTNWKRRL
jgi:hypothetical protein